MRRVCCRSVTAVTVRRVLVLLAAAVVLAVAVPVAVKAERLGVQHGWLTNPSVRNAPDLKPRAVEEVMTGLEAPWGLAFLPDGSVLMTERDTARILSVQGGSVREVTRIAESRPSGEGGLLGIAVSPTYTTIGCTSITLRRTTTGSGDCASTIQVKS